MKFKIQTACPYGWADLKDSSVDPPEVELFDSEFDAEKEMNDILLHCEGASPESYRVVPESTPEDMNLY